MNGKTISDKKWIPPVVILLGVVLIGMGIYRGELATIFSKATAICLECIGIG